ncbi:MAG: hypothetical protein AB8H86_23690 [Polyangiales bacterium]
MDTIEPSKSSRAACRQCGEKIKKGELRFGEEYESEYGASYRWYHLPCAAKKLPALLKKTLEGYEGEVENREALFASANKPAEAKVEAAPVPLGPKTNDKIEVAKSSRSKCRQCGEKIEKGKNRFGEEYESEYGLSFRWYHLPCAAKKLPALFGNTLGHHEGEIEERAELLALLSGGGDSTPQEILPDYPDVSIAPTGRASCIQCREKIEKGATRISVEVDIEIRGRMSRGAGYMHAPCVGSWLGENEDVDAAEFNRIIVAKGGAASEAKVAVVRELPDLGTVSGDKLRAIAKKIIKLKDHYRIADHIQDNVPYKLSSLVVFHLIAHDAIDVGKNVYLLRGMREYLNYDGCENPGDEDRRLAHVDTIAKALLQIPSKPAYDSHPTFANLPDTAVELGLFLVRHAPDKAREIYPSLKPNVQVAISLPMLIDEMELPEGATEALTDAMAPLIGDYAPTFYVPGQDHVELKPDVDALIERMGTQERWMAHCLKAMKKKECDIQTVFGLRKAIETATKAPILNALESILNNHSDPKGWDEFRPALQVRDDLNALAKHVAKPASKATERLKLLVFGLAEKLPKGAEDTLDFSSLSGYDGRFVPLYEAVLRLAGEKRALAAGQRALANDDLRPSGKAWVTLLARIYGDAASDHIARLIELGRTESTALYHLNLAPQACLEEVQKHDDLMAKSELLTGIAAGFASAGEEIPDVLDEAIASRPYDFPKYTNRLSDERWIRVINMALETNPPGKAIGRVQGTSDPVRQHCVEQLVERRKKIKKQFDGREAFRAVDPNAVMLMPLMAKVDAGEKKFFRLLEKSYDKATYGKLCDAAGKKVLTRAEKLLALSGTGGDTGKRPVLFYPAKGDLAPLAVETLSYSGDVPPPGVERPKGVEEDKKHILSFDLSPFPALVQQFGHETMSLFVEAPNSGEFNEQAELIGSPKLSAIPEGGRAMDIGAIDLPEKLRKSGRSADAKELRSVLGGLDAHAFGPAYWIQQNLGDSVTLQLNDSFINLGDTGSFYTGYFGTTWQCY